MSELVSGLTDQLALIGKVSDYIISIDVLENGTYLTASTLTDTGTEDILLPLEDIVYLTEYGTATFPGKFILEHIVNWTVAQLDRLLDEIYTGIFEQNWRKSNLDIAFNQFENKVNMYIQTYLAGYYETIHFLQPVPGATKDISFLMDISLLQKYIRCKISKK